MRAQGKIRGILCRACAATALAAATALPLMTVSQSGVLAADPKAQAADPKAPSKADDKRKALDSKREALDANRKREQEIQQDLAALSAERAKLRVQSSEAAATVQEAETKLSAVEAKVAELESQEGVLRGSLTKRFGQISKLLSVLQRMGRNPPPVMITKRQDALKMVRSAMLISSSFPELRADAVALAAKLNELVAVMEGAKVEREKAQSATAELQDKRTKLAALIEAKRQAQTERQIELASVRAAAADITKDVKDLTKDLTSEMMDKLDQNVSKNTAMGAYNQQAEQGNQQVAALPPANALEPAPPGAGGSSGKHDRLAPSELFHLAKAKLPLPAAGRRVLSFGEKTQYGAQSKGIVIETRPNAQVTSPCDGWIVFAGEFRSYGRVLIINPGGGYHVLMAGLSQIDASIGQFVVASEPVGTMSGSPSAEGAGQSTSPVLYVEFRKDKEPVDPDPWWAGSQKVESGKKVQG